MDIRSYLKEHTLLFDGGMSTYYAERNNTRAEQHRRRCLRMGQPDQSAGG